MAHGISSSGGYSAVNFSRMTQLRPQTPPQTPQVSPQYSDTDGDSDSSTTSGIDVRA